MAFAIEEYEDVLRFLRDHPELRPELRRLILTDDLLDLPAIVRDLADAQRRTEQRVDDLAEAQGRTEQRLSELAEAQRRTEERLERLTARVDQLAARVAELAEAQKRTEERLGRLEQVVVGLAESQRQLAESQKRMERALGKFMQSTEERFAAIEARLQPMDQLVTDVAYLKGRFLEFDYRDNATGYFGSGIRKARALPKHDLEDELEGHLSQSELADVLRLDLTITGTLRNAPGEQVILAIEVSSVLDPGDVTRVLRRAELIRRTGRKVIPVVAGNSIREDAAFLARTQNVAVVQDGREVPWAEIAAAWV